MNGLLFHRFFSNYTENPQKIYFSSSYDNELHITILMSFMSELDKNQAGFLTEYEIVQPLSSFLITRWLKGCIWHKPTTIMIL